MKSMIEVKSNSFDDRESKFSLYLSIAKSTRDPEKYIKS